MPSRPDGWVSYEVEGVRFGIPWAVRFYKYWHGDTHFNWFAHGGTGRPEHTGRLTLTLHEGGTKIELWADGKRVLGQKGASFSYDWFGSSKIAYGEHRIELRAYDEAGHVGVAATTVRRGDPVKSPRTVKAALGLKVRKAGSRFKVRATVKPPADGSFAEQPHGRLVLRFERKAGRKWKRSKVRKGIGDGGVHYAYTARQAGTWRVYGVLDADAPYKKTRTKVFTFRVR